jgi:pimeloyl-ACP methyl ester carboxylesterase/glyoxylase-like metal-dependent hydrolase (beta-lactamase superfamily II)
MNTRSGLPLLAVLALILGSGPPARPAAGSGSTTQSPMPVPIAIPVGDFIFDGLAAGPAGGDPVILLHGFPQTSYAFRHQLEALAAAGYRAVAPDQRGYSPDARPAAVADYALPELVGDVVGIADALEFETFHLVGHDWGGAVAWMLAGTFPDRVRSLTVLSTPHPDAFRAAIADPNGDQAARSSYFAMFRAAGAEQRFLANDAAFLRQVLDGVDREAIGRYVGVLGTPEAVGAALNWYRATDVGQAAADDPERGATAASRRDAAAVPTREVAAAPQREAAAPFPVPLDISVPTLYVWGGEDRAFSRAAAEATARWVSGPYRFVPLERADHWLMERATREVNELLLDHLADSESPYHVAFREIRPGIWLAWRRDPFRSPAFGNVTIIINDDDVVVVDSGSSPAAARQIVAKIRALTAAPVTVLVNTLAHEDHVLGNQVFAEAYPGVQLVAPESVRDQLAGGAAATRVRDFARRRRAHREAGVEEIARLQRRGLIGDDQIVAHLRRYVDRDMDVVAEAYAGARLTPPTTTFAGSLPMQRGERLIELLDLGSGSGGPSGDSGTGSDDPHPGGDPARSGGGSGGNGSGMLVYLPREKLVIAGDIVTRPVPYGFAHSQTAWLDALKKLAALDFDAVVPGHGEAVVDRAYVERIIELVEFEIAEVRRAVRQGHDAAATAWQINFGRWAERFVGDDPVGRYRFQTWFVEPAVARAHAELSGS